MFISYYLLVIRNNICIGERIYADKITAISEIIGIVSRLFGENEAASLRARFIDIYFSGSYKFRYKTEDILLIEYPEDTVINIQTFVGSEV